jgi:hypothetical protein
MTVIKNQTQLLTSGAQGEVAAKVAGHFVAFTRVTVGDANGVLPEFNLARTALDNHVKEGSILSHAVDVENADQRKLVLRIAPDENYEARELLIFATANGVEFPHSYIRLGSAYPIRTPENDGIQVTIEVYIKVSSETVFNINVKPATDYISRPEFDGHNHDDDHKTFDITKNETAITTKDKLHIFTDKADLQIPDDAGTSFRYTVDESVVLTDVNECRLLAPSVLAIENDKMLVNGTPSDICNIQETGVIHHAIKVNGVWKT